MAVKQISPRGAIFQNERRQEANQIAKE